MKLPGKPTLIANTVLLALVLFLYVADVWDWMRARTAEVSAMPQLPRAGYAGLVLGATLACLLVTLYGMFTDKPKEFRGYRLLPIVAIIGLFVDLFVLSVDTLPVPSPHQAAIILDAFAREASARSGPDQVVDDNGALSDIMKDFNAPPYLVRGKPAEGWTLQIRHNCEGPVLDAPGAQVGTLLYCVSKDRKQAWVSLVALPFEERFGSPRVMTQKGVPLAVVVEPIPEAEKAALPNGVEEGIDPSEAEQKPE